MTSFPESGCGSVEAGRIRGRPDRPRHGFILFPLVVPNFGEGPYSAFIRAIIFLFAAFSLRLRRSLGFSKCW